jgi:hypothetical protein
MTSSHPLPAPCQWFARLASALDRRSPPRLALLFLGAVLARGRRAVTSWIPADKLSGQFRLCYSAVAAAGKRADRSGKSGRRRESAQPGRMTVIISRKLQCGRKTKKRMSDPKHPTPSTRV